MLGKSGKEWACGANSACAAVGDLRHLNSEVPPHGAENWEAGENPALPPQR